MSSLAHIMLHNGKKVSGSDTAKSHLTDELEALGAKISVGQRAENITNPDLVVYTAAISEDNEELCEARKKGIRCIERAYLLGEIMKHYDIIVAGGGFAGVGAAVAAARMGRSVLLIEEKGCLGGAAANSLVLPFMPYYTFYFR